MTRRPSRRSATSTGSTIRSLSSTCANLNGLLHVNLGISEHPTGPAHDLNEYVPATIDSAVRDRDLAV